MRILTTSLSSDSCLSCVIRRKDFFLNPSNLPLPQTNRMMWRSRHRHPRRERRRSSSRSSSWWHRSAGSRRCPTGLHSPAAASHASASRLIRRSCCPRSWRTSTSGAWTSSPCRSFPTTDLSPASCTPSFRYEVSYFYQYSPCHHVHYVIAAFWIIAWLLLFFF